MGLQDELVAIQVAPAARVPLAMFEEIDRSLELIVPAGVGDSAAGLIEDQKRARLQQRIHEPILGADKGIPMILKL